MTVYVCSLATTAHQKIAPDAYTPVRFPYDAAESLDPLDMHSTTQPDGVTSTFPDNRSALIWPEVEGWATLTACIHWESGDYTELRDRFVRDPFNLSTGYDSTATDHRAPTPGIQCFTKHHDIWVHPETPLALFVAHNASSPRKLVYAQFKMYIHPA